MLGDGFLQQMGQTLKYNRDLLMKRKSPREIYMEEVGQRNLRFEHYDLNEVRARVKQRLKRNKFQEFTGRIIANILLLAVGYGIYWAIQSVDYFGPKEAKQIDSSQFFTTKIYHQKDGMDLRIDYFKHGPKAAETLMKNGLRHQHSESFYESGEQFRTALYYRDTLVNELYLFKSGDTIREFPKLADTRLYHLLLENQVRRKKVEFDFFDWKVVAGTYKEYPLDEK